MPDHHLGLAVGPILDAIDGLGDAVALDRELARLDLEKPGAELGRLALALHSQAALERERNGGGAARRQRLQQPLTQERPFFEDGNRPALQQASGFVGEANYPERMRDGVRYPA